MTSPSRDRYITFAGLDCDANARAVVDLIRRHITHPAAARGWGDYFSMKLKEQIRLGVDDLFFVGSQLNNIYALFELCEEREGSDLLYQVEQECC